MHFQFVNTQTHKHIFKQAYTYKWTPTHTDYQRVDRELDIIECYRQVALYLYYETNFNTPPIPAAIATNENV